MPDTGTVWIRYSRLTKQEFNLAPGHTNFELCYYLGINPVTLRDIESIDAGGQGYK